MNYLQTIMDKFIASLRDSKCCICNGSIGTEIINSLYYCNTCCWRTSAANLKRKDLITEVYRDVLIGKNILYVDCYSSYLIITAPSNSQITINYDNDHSLMILDTNEVLIKKLEKYLLLI